MTTTSQVVHDIEFVTFCLFQHKHEVEVNQLVVAHGKVQ